MRRLLATLALGLLTACTATAATSDALTRTCDDCAYAVQAVAPLKAKLDPQVVGSGPKTSWYTTPRPPSRASACASCLERLCACE